MATEGNRLFGSCATPAERHVVLTSHYVFVFMSRSRLLFWLGRSRLSLSSYIPT